MRQIRFRPGLCPGPHRGSLQRSPVPLAASSWYKGGLLLRGGQGLKTLFCVLTDELLRAKDDLFSEGGQSLSSLTEQLLWLSVSVSCIMYSKMRKFRPKMRQNAFGGRAPPGPAGGA